MNKYKYIAGIAGIIAFISILAFTKFPDLGKNQEEPWRPNQLMETADLAAALDRPNDPQPLIICVGPSGLIKNSVEVGSVKEKENLNKLRTLLENKNKETSIVIYCGCCPFKNCPNIRPAFQLLNEMKFVNHKLLNIPRNIRVDWVDKKFPVSNK